MHASGWMWIVTDYFACKRIRKNLNVPFPCSPLIKVTKPENIGFDPDDLHIFQSQGSYFQAYGKISIGKGTYIAPNVGLIIANHSFEELDDHLEAKSITIGERCWIGMNAMILPGVVLGNHTVVGAGAVVTKSFPEGNCVIAGSPAKIIKEI